MSSAPSNNSSSSRSESLQALQTCLEYQFRDEALLQLALTHKSHSKHNNERLEFLGDAVLGYLIAELLYRTHGDHREDVLSLMRARVVRGSALAEVARQLDLAPHLLLGSGERKSGGRQRDSILADAFEAVIGAMHEDGGIEPCRQLVGRLFHDWITELDPEVLKDAKTKLQERLQARQLSLPVYAVEQVSGADHARSYTVSCRVAGLDLEVSACGSSRRKAEQKAAELALDLLDQQT